VVYDAVVLFDNDKKEERVQINTLDHIYDFSERLRRTAREYAIDAETLVDESVVPPLT
jgi:hypothetical protein